jgi:hypothetical protein
MSKEHSIGGQVRLGPLFSEFETLGTITTQGTTLAVGGRAWTNVKSYFNAPSATYVAWKVPIDANAAEFRFQTTADADAQVVSVWGACGKDHFTLLAILTLTGGTQVGDSSKVFVDTIVASSEGLFQSGKVMDSATNRICRYGVDLNGYSKLLFIATTLAANTNLVIQGRVW